MPTYEYVCGACATRVDIVHSLHAEGPRFCPSCGAEDSMRKAFAPPAIHFKGSGWAKKDRSHRAPTKAAESSGADKDSKSATGVAPAGDGATSSGEGSGSKAGASTGSSSAAVD